MLLFSIYYVLVSLLVQDNFSVKGKTISALISVDTWFLFFNINVLFARQFQRGEIS